MKLSSIADRDLYYGKIQRRTIRDSDKPVMKRTKDFVPIESLGLTPVTTVLDTMVGYPSFSGSTNDSWFGGVSSGTVFLGLDFVFK